MRTDQSLKQAVEAMEWAGRRLREVIDGPAVAAALVERQAGPRPMSTAPSDGTPVTLHFADGEKVLAYFSQAYAFWRYSGGTVLSHPLGWSPVK